MDDRELAEILLRDHLLAASALATLQLRQLSPNMLAVTEAQEIRG